MAMLPPLLVLGAGQIPHWWDECRLGFARPVIFPYEALGDRTAQALLAGAKDL
jgi:hypothetical protein